MKRSYGIDLVRTLSILIVMLRHYGVLGGFNFGIYAIEFLFVVSGYLIGQILLKSFNSFETVTLSKVKLFMIRRWFRILPLYYLAIFIKFICFPAVGKNIIYYVLFLQNHFYGISFFPETWSLVIDEWFYLGTPLLLFLFIKFVSFNKKYVFLYLTFIIIVINLLRWFWVYKTNIPWSGINGNVILHQDTLLIGVLLAFIKHHYTTVFNRLNSKLVFFTSVMLFAIYIYIIKLYRWPIDLVDDSILLRTISFTTAAGIIAMMLPYIENKIPPLKHRFLMFINKIVVMGSKLSYALYLFHGMAMLLVHAIFKNMFNLYINALIAVVLSTLISYILYEYLEKKCLIIRDRYFPENNPTKI